MCLNYEHYLIQSPCRELIFIRNQQNFIFFFVLVQWYSSKYLFHVPVYAYSIHILIKMTPCVTEHPKHNMLFHWQFPHLMGNLVPLRSLALHWKFLFELDVMYLHEKDWIRILTFVGLKSFLFTYNMPLPSNFSHITKSSGGSSRC